MTGQPTSQFSDTGRGPVPNPRKGRIDDDLNQQIYPGAIVAGKLKRYLEAKRIGWVNVYLGLQMGSVDVFIHADRAVKVEGTHYEFELSTAPAQPYLGGRRMVYEIVMLVDKDRQGRWYAKAWGIRPRRYWYDRYIKQDVLAGFLGGKLEISGGGASSQSARIDACELTRTSLKVAGRYYPGWWMRPDEAEAEGWGDPFEAAYSIEWAELKELPYGRFSLSIDVPGSGGRVRTHLVFSPAAKP